jgi:hypothetical protein
VPRATEVVLAVEHDDVVDAETAQGDGGTHAAEAGPDDEGFMDLAVGLGGHAKLLKLGYRRYLNQ